ncbi:choice-of-anchor Q domain-containing protein [Nannocystis pusilla]|uniref:choice-of-anchor Q domain-containing protein n=1 Tax=Nannocystis pusilla TaxID=889268 RepID=UPI003DA4819F
MSLLARRNHSSISTCILGATLLACSSAPNTTDDGSTGGSSSGGGETATADTGSSTADDSLAPTTTSGEGSTSGPTTSDSEGVTGTTGGSTGDDDSTGDSSSGGATSGDDEEPPSTTFDERGCTIFVDQLTGEDGNSGKAKDQALATIKAATGIVAAGDTVCVYPGNYGAFKNTAHGTADARIHYVSVERWQAKVSAPTIPLQNVGDYVDIDGFEVTTTDETVGLGISNGDGQLANHCRIFNNHVYGIVAKTRGGSGGAGILSAGWVSQKPYQGEDVEIFNNFVHDIGNPGENAGFVQGIYVSHPHAKIYNNIVYNVSGWGIHGWHNANYVTVSNNLTSNTEGIVLGNGDSPCGQITCEFTDYYVTNNILYADRVGIVLYDGPNHLVSTNNFYLTDPSGDNPTTDDPQLVGYALDPAGDFHLGPTSPMIDAGSPEFAPAFDFDGKARPKGVAPDVGPYER